MIPFVKVLRSRVCSARLGALAPLLALVGCATYQPRPLTDSAVAHALTMPASGILIREAEHLDHPVLRPIQLNPNKPLSPDQAAVLAVLINPELRAQRDRIGISSAQVIQAGLLPNPQLSPSAGFVVAGPGNTNPYGIGADFDITALITRDAKKRAAELSLQSVRLDVAWAEWQTAETAKSAVYGVIALNREVEEAEATDHWLTRNLDIIQGAYARHQQTVLQLSAARAASDSAHATVLSLQQQLAAERSKLRSAMGLPVETSLQVRQDGQLPCELPSLQERDVLNGFADRRLDLLALKRGYASQELHVREAILAQFPKLNLGVNEAKDNSGVTTVGFSATISLPIFNHNQGAIAVQRATRQQLSDEYVGRLSRARTDVAKLYADIETLRPRIAAEQSTIPQLESLVATLRRAMLMGNENLVTYYGQIQNLTTARIDLIKLEGQLANDWVALELASGEMLPKPEACEAMTPMRWP